MMNSPLISTLYKKKQDFTSVNELRPLIEPLKEKKIVMLGESSHGTHEYYHWRAKISRMLLEDYDFDFVAVEGDWPPCYLLNRHVKNYQDAPKDTYKVLRKFERWPSWMWANWEVHEWAQWLKEFNSGRPVNQRKGFYGLDVYSLWESLDAIEAYLKKEDPSALETARRAMRCFEPHRGEDGQQYALSTRLVPEGCSQEVTEMLIEIKSKIPVYNSDREHVFSTEQNALITKNAEEYYRVMMQGTASTWNLRDQHMMDTLDRLLKFHGEEAKGIVWAHNTHIGDASYTDMSRSGLFNIGELARKKYGEEAVSLIGFGSYEGTVLAGRAWGEPVEKMELPKARNGSWEAICHEIGEQFYLSSSHLRDNKELSEYISHRAVGVVYNPERERLGNYVPTILPKRYDAFVFFDHSMALNPIDINEELSKVPETYPFGL